MSKWISGKEIIEKKGISTLELFEYVLKGLQPHDKKFNQVPPPDVQRKQNDLIECERSLVYIREMLSFCKLGAPSITNKLKELVAEGRIKDPRTYADAGDDLLHTFTPKNLEAIKKEEKRMEESVRTLEMELSGVQNSSWTGYSLDEDINLVINYLKNSLFKLSDVEKIIKQYEHANKGQLSREYKTVFPCKPGTKWEDIKITLTDNETVRIKTPLGEGLFPYHKLNMYDKRMGNRPTMLWGLLTLFAKNGGFISSRSEEYNPTLQSTAKRLNKHLQNLFNIRGSIYESHYKKLKRFPVDPIEKKKMPEQDLLTTQNERGLKGYKTKIFFSDQTTVIS